MPKIGQLVRPALKKISLKSRRDLSVEERFELSHVKGLQSNDCWEWIAHRHIDGPALITVQGKQIPASRYAYSILVGEIPEGLIVRHTCDNPGCVNPRHLIVGTQLDNIQDMVDRQRQHHPIGELNPKAKISEANAKYIKEVWQKGSRGEYGSKALALRFGVCYVTIQEIGSGKRWSYLD